MGSKICAIPNHPTRRLLHAGIDHSGANPQDSVGADLEATTCSSTIRPLMEALTAADVGPHWRPHQGRFENSGGVESVLAALPGWLELRLFGTCQTGNWPRTAMRCAGCK